MVIVRFYNSLNTTQTLHQFIALQSQYLADVKTKQPIYKTGLPLNDLMYVIWCFYNGSLISLLGLFGGRSKRKAWLFAFDSSGPYIYIWTTIYIVNNSKNIYQIFCVLSRSFIGNIKILKNTKPKPT